MERGLCHEGAVIHVDDLVGVQPGGAGGLSPGRFAERNVIHARLFGQRQRCVVALDGHFHAAESQADDWIDAKAREIQEDDPGVKREKRRRKVHVKIRAAFLSVGEASRSTQEKALEKHTVDLAADGEVHRVELGYVRRLEIVVDSRQIEVETADMEPAEAAEADLARNVYPPALRTYVREYFSGLGQ